MFGHGRSSPLLTNGPAIDAFHQAWWHTPKRPYRHLHPPPACVISPTFTSPRRSASGSYWITCRRTRPVRSIKPSPLAKPDACCAGWSSITRNDAAGIARIMQTGWFKEVRVKDLDSHSVRALLASRALLVKIKRDLAFPLYLLRCRKGRRR
jgi:hypothetical protein